jgi:hypothetical protein
MSLRGSGRMRPARRRLRRRDREGCPLLSVVTICDGGSVTVFDVSRVRRRTEEADDRAGCNRTRQHCVEFEIKRPSGTESCTQIDGKQAMRGRKLACVDAASPRQAVVFPNPSRNVIITFADGEDTQGRNSRKQRRGSGLGGSPSRSVIKNWGVTHRSV